MNEQRDGNLTAVEVIRCVYLARIAEKHGDIAAARRWQAQADTWLRETEPPTVPSPLEGRIPPP